MSNYIKMRPHDHYRAAEALLEVGAEVVNKIADVADRRKDVAYGTPGDRPDEYARLTAWMDELGKKAMGIWAQAQVHATLSGGETVESVWTDGYNQALKDRGYPL